MAANRWAFHLLLAAGLPVLPACLSMPRAEPTPVASPPTAPRDQFAELIRAPGERVTLNRPTEPVAEAGAADPPQPPAPIDPPLTAEPPPSPEPGPLPPRLPVTPPDPLLVAVVRAQLENRPDVALEHLKSLDRPNQELILQLLPVLVRASQGSLGHASPVEIGALARELDGAAVSLAGRSPLFVEKAVFCRAVKNFGRYEEFPDRHSFRPDSTAGLYVELRNVPSEPVSSPTEGDGYVTKLVCSLEVRDAAGNVIELPDRHRKPVRKLQDVKRDFTRSPVRDYFVVFWVPIPSRPGAYTVTVDIRDPSSGRAVSRTMPFRVQ